MVISSVPFYFMRHGETDWNRRRIYMGWRDIPLNQLGIEQANIAAKLLRDEPIEHIVSSPLSRTLQTAEIIAAPIERPITIIDELKERSWGSKEGKPIDDNSILKNWHKESLKDQVEKIEDFEKRIIKGFIKALTLPKPVLIIAHGGVHYILQNIIGLPLTNLGNCAPIYYCPPQDVSGTWSASYIARKE